MSGEMSLLGSLLFYLFCFGLPCLICNINIENRALKFILIAIPPLILGTIRYNVGYDYGSYITGYHNSYDITYSSIIENFKFGDPVAFDLLTKFATIFHSDRFFLFVTSFFSLVPGMIYIFLDWDKDDLQPLILFGYLFNQYIFSFSAIKQGIAISFLVASLHYIYKRKPIQYLFLILIAFFFHSPSISFAFVYFLIGHGGSIKSFAKTITIVFAFFALVNLQSVTALMFDDRFDRYFSTDVAQGRNRTIILYTIITVICLIYRNYLIGVDQRNELLIFLMIIGTMCQFLGYANAFTKRLGDYFVFSQTFLLPQFCGGVTEKSKPVFKLLLAAYIFIIFLLGHLPAASGMKFYPYQYAL